MQPASSASRILGQRLLAASGAVLAAASIALLAYAAHAAVPAPTQARLHTAGLIAALHGIALAALAPRAASRTTGVALGGLLLGTLLFAGTLVAAHAFGTGTGTAPAGGVLLMLSWLLLAADALRR